MVSSPNKKTCPECGSKLELKSGRNGPFFGCSGYQSHGCGFTRDNKPAAPRAIDWRDCFNWGQLQVSYLSIGSAPGFLDLKAIDKVKAAPSKTLLISRIDSASSPNPYSLVCQSVSKILLRGEYSFSGFSVEQALFEVIPAELKPTTLSKSDPEIGYEELLKVNPNAVLQCLAERFSGIDESAPIGHLAFDSQREVAFFTKWIPSVLGHKAVAWFTPQAPLDMLFNALGEDDVSFRRADFMFYVPGNSPVVIEIDGDDHKQKQQADAERDAELAKHNIRTVRIPNAEMDNLKGPKLDELAEICGEILNSFEAEKNELQIARSLLISSECSQIQYALIYAVMNGFPVGKSGKVKVKFIGDVPTETLLKAAIDDLNQLITHYAALFNAEGIKPLCFNLTDGSSKAKEILSVRLQFNASPATLASIGAEADVILCRAILPSELLPPPMPIMKKPLVSLDKIQAAEHLTFFLNYLFRKREFRGQQLDAILNILSDKDTLVLQPTGAGKSIIYQLSGQLLPGVTIVIDPIKALIEDQVRGLNEHRISRAVGLMSSDRDPLQLQRMLASIANGHVHYILMSPERFLVQSFRSTLANLVRQCSVNLAVIDEAHCLSQWGHDFRFAYLRLAENLKKYCYDKINGAPKLLALTGTASRSVLKEMIAEIGINLSDEGSIVKPSSFNRTELQFSVLKLGKGGATFGELNETLLQLPAKLEKEQDGFFQSNGRDTNSGIIFTPHVTSKSHGLVAIKNKISEQFETSVGMFSGGAPEGFTTVEWEKVKADHANAFKANDQPILVATNAFGMGVDKPNIRWTVHMGIPRSIEAFYQEAGRAGRDRKRSHCSVIFSETDETFTNKVLAPSNSLEDMRELQKGRSFVRDDIDRALYFHLNNFSSVEEELKIIDLLLNMVDFCSSAKTLELPYSDRRKGVVGKLYKEDLERALVRMSYCALIEDYTTNYSGKTFTVTFAKYDFKRSKEKLLNYISKVQPAQVKLLAKKLDDILTGVVRQQPAEICRQIIEFTYDTIERSRRRMMFEAVQLARNGNTDAQIRDRLLNYLEEGANSARVTELVEAQTIEFGDWLDISDSLSTPSDARDLRGDVSRMLESYPYHAGLLLSRSISEALSGNGDLDVIKANLKAALLNEGVTKAQMNNLIVSLLDRTKTGLKDYAAPLMGVLFECFEKSTIRLDKLVVEELKTASEQWTTQQRNMAIQFATIIEIQDVIPALEAQAENMNKSLEIVRG